MSISEFIKTLDNAAACVDRQGEYLGTQSFDRKFDQIADIKIIIRDEDYDLYFQIFMADIKVFDACISGDELELFAYQEGAWQDALEKFATAYPPRNPTTFSDLSNLNLVDYR